MLYEYCGEGESLPLFVSDSMQLHLEIEQFDWYLLGDNVVALLNRVVCLFKFPSCEISEGLLVNPSYDFA